MRPDYKNSTRISIPPSPGKEIKARKIVMVAERWHPVRATLDLLKRPGAYTTSIQSMGMDILFCFASLVI